VHADSKRGALLAGRTVVRVYAVALLAAALLATYVAVVEARSARRSGRTAAAWRAERARWHATAVAQAAAYARSLAALREAQRTFRVDAALLDAQQLAYRGALALARTGSHATAAGVGGGAAGSVPAASVVSASSAPTATRTS
jgi:hypothetical protein